MSEDKCILPRYYRWYNGAVVDERTTRPRKTQMERFKRAFLSSVLRGSAGLVAVVLALPGVPATGGPGIARGVIGPQCHSQYAITIGAVSGGPYSVPPL